jgi:hypothetical protein
MMADNSEKIQQYCFLFNLVNPQREKFHVDGKTHGKTLLKGIKLTFRKEKRIYAYSKLPKPQIFRQKTINVGPLILVNRDRPL